MADGFGGSVPLYLLIAGAVAILLLARRFRVVGRVVSFAFMLGAIALVVMLVAERGRFDPTFARIAGLLHLDGESGSVGQGNARADGERRAFLGHRRFGRSSGACSSIAARPLPRCRVKPPTPLGCGPTTARSR